MSIIGKPIRMYKVRLFIKKLTDGGYSTETRRNGRVETDSVWSGDFFKSLKKNQLVNIEGEIYLVISCGGSERLDNDFNMVDFVELLPIKLKKHIRELVSGNTWNP